MSEHLLLVTLGPIQDFISAARKAQDLWFGSWLLSDLARSAAKAIGDAEGATTLVFPESVASEMEGREPSVANRIVALVHGGAEATRAAARRGEAAMAERLEEHMARCFDLAMFSRAFDRGRAEAQVRDLMEFQWVAVPVEQGAYVTALERADHELAAVKNTKRWSQVAWGAPVPKSSVDGLRESVFNESLFERARGDERARLHLAAGERLCGVGYLKRRGAALGEADDSGAAGDPRRPVFHSASHVASATLRMAAQVGNRRDDVEAALEELLRELANVRVEERHLRLRAREPGDPTKVRFPSWASALGGVDPYRCQHVKLVASRERLRIAEVDNVLLFPERMEEIVEEATGQSDVELRGVRDKLARLHRALGTSEDSLPTYYAMLLADGDNMGAYLEAVARARGHEGHQQVSKNLVEFARHALTVVESHAGSPVYAGGDDVLAFVPLPTALSCADALRSEFRAIVGAGLDDVEGRPTLSVGLAIAHHLAPLSDVRRQAKDAETLAKAQPDKNALGIVVERRSGPRIELVGSWCEQPGPSLRERLDQYAGWLDADVLSRKTAHDLRSALGLLGGDDEPGLRASVARGVLRQKRRGSKAGHGLEGLVERLEAGGFAERALRSLGDELDVAWMLCKAYRSAAGVERLSPQVVTDISQAREETGR